VGGFESILSKMTRGNFNWFLYIMMLVYILEAIWKQDEKQMKDEDEESETENK